MRSASAWCAWLAVRAGAISSQGDRFLLHPRKPCLLMLPALTASPTHHTSMGPSCSLPSCPGDDTRAATSGSEVLAVYSSMGLSECRFCYQKHFLTCSPDCLQHAHAGLVQFMYPHYLSPEHRQRTCPGRWHAPRGDSTAWRRYAACPAARPAAGSRPYWCLPPRTGPACSRCIRSRHTGLTEVTWEKTGAS